MTELIKILGQAVTTTGTVTPIYTAANPSVISLINICNTLGSAQTFRLHAIENGNTAATTNAIIYDQTIPANDALPIVGGFTLALSGMIKGYSSNSGICYSVFGSEVS